MSCTLKYGRTEIELNLKPSTAADFLERENNADGLPGGRDIIMSALLNTRLRLKDFISVFDSVAIVVSDQTRPTGSDVFLPIIIEEIKAAGGSDIVVILAQGLHRPARAEEIEKIFGGRVPDGVRVVNHDAENDLKQSGGAFFRSEAVDADKLIITGTVTFHPMAGFSGGRKSLLPGIASGDDIRRNHRLYFKDKEHNPACGPGLINNNPVRDDLTRRTRGFENLWALNVVLGDSKEIIFASCGDADEVWQDCVRYVSSNFSIGIGGKYDTVISSAGGYPSDFSFYQSMKVLTNSARACREGGRLIILSECSNGWEIDAEMLKLFSFPLSEITDRLIENFRMDVLGMFMALSIIRKYDVWLYSSLPRAEVELAGMHYLDDKSMIEELILEGRTAIIKNGSSILPISDEQRKELL
ncbi:MAG: nickel-dependent lactate racemase [Spirochaetales bacterium]|nr:nickel-dependent lactate racemase [Spirochaetales bacterium]